MVSSGNPLSEYTLAFAGAALAVVVAAAARRWGGLEDLSLVFIVAVLAVASRTRTGPAVATAVLCFLGYNFFFIEPLYTLHIASRQGVVTVMLFLVAALVTGRLASALAMQLEALGRAHAHAVARQQLSSRLAEAVDEATAVRAVVDILRHALAADAWIRLGAGDLQHRSGSEQHGWWFVPLQHQGSTLGLVALRLPAHRRPLDDTQRSLVQAIGDELAQTLQRLRLVEALQAERLSGETERLRNALLSSVSHDLRTPLAAIIGAAGSLQDYGAAMSDAERRELLETVRMEGERLDRYIQNLLDMTRLEQGGIELERAWVDVDVLIAGATARLHRVKSEVPVAVHLAPGVGAVRVNSALLEQALLNVLENAARYTPRGEGIVLEARHASDDSLVIEISDRGPGIPADERERVFDMFYQVERGDRERGGTGLGLAICRGVMAAHGGHAAALEGRGGVGATIRFSLPSTAGAREQEWPSPRAS